LFVPCGGGGAETSCQALEGGQFPEAEPGSIRVQRHFGCCPCRLKASQSLGR
jgi:hypothetical protein